MTDQDEDDGHESPDGDAESEDRSDDAGFTTDDAVRDVLRGAGIVYVGLVAEMGLAFLAQRFAAVYLSIGGFGNLLSGTALLDVGAVIAGLGFPAGLARYLPRVDQEEQRPLAAYVIWLTVPASLVVAVPGVIYADVLATRVFGEPEFTLTLRIFAGTIPFAALLNVGLGGIRGQKISRFRVYVKNILQPGVRFGLIITAVLLGAGQAGFAAGYAVPFVVAALLAVGLFWRTLPETGNARRARERFPEFARYSLPFTISRLASFLYRSVDIFLLLYIVGNRAVGAYGVAYAFARLISMFSTAFNYLSTPVSSQLESDDRIGEALTVQTTVARWTTITTIGALVPMLLFAGDFLRIIYRPAYTTAVSTLSILAVGFGAKNTLRTHAPIVKALGRSKLSAFNTGVAGVVNLVANLVLIPRYGIEGAAVATTASYLVLGLLPTVEVWYLTGRTTLTRKVVAPAVLAVPAALVAVPVFRAVPSTLLWTVTASALFAAFYLGVVVVVLGLSPTDVMIIRSLEERYGVSLGPLDAVIRWLS